MFSVRCQTPSADAEEIHPKWWWDGGRDGCGRREKRREKSAGFFSHVTFLSVPMSETVKARPLCATSGREAKPASWQRRWRSPGWQGHRTTACNHDCSPCNRGLHAKPDGPEETDTLQQTHHPSPAKQCLPWGQWGQTVRVEPLCPHSSDPGPPHLKPLSCLAGGGGGFRGRTRSEPCIPFPWSSALACARPQSPAVFAPRSPCLRTTN